jgi:predicted membrane metal-binding protein
MASNKAMTGWISFAGLLMILIGSLDFFEGLIAVIRKEYYVFTPSQIIIFNVSTWGWVMMLWGILLACAGFGLLAGSSWARWFAIVVVSLNLIGQLGFVGSSQYPLWALTVVGLTITVLYALTARWGDPGEAY